MDSIFFFFGFITPPALICAIVHFAGTKILHPKLGTLVKRSAVVIFVVLALPLYGATLGTIACSGDVISGFKNCVGFLHWLPNLSVIAFLFATILSVIYICLLAIAAAFLEWRFRAKG